MTGSSRRRKFWGWGYEGEGLSREEDEQLASLLAARLGVSDVRIGEGPRIESIRLRDPRLSPPGGDLGELFSVVPRDRAEHALGKSFRDLVRGFEGRYENPPDLVAFPRDEKSYLQLALKLDREPVTSP